MGIELLVESAVFSEGHLSGIVLVYMGPGAGLAAVGALLAVIGVAGMTVVGLVWYPIRQTLRKLRAWREKESPSPRNDPGEQAESGGEALRKPLVR